MDYRLKKLSEYIQGWMAYFALSQYYSPVPELDEWLKSQGLVSMRDIWIAFHYPAANQSGKRAVSR